MTHSVEARIAQERKYFPMQVTVLYFLGHSANASSALVARQLSTVGVKAKKIHGYYTDKHVNGEPNTLALIDVEFEDIQQAHKFFDEGLCWPESIMASNRSFADRLSYYWNNPVPDTDEELHEMTAEISSIIKQAVKIGAVKKLDSSATARVANEVRHFPRTILALCYVGMTRDGSEITDDAVARSWFNSGGRLKRLRGLYLEKKDEDVRPKAHVKVIALVDIEILSASDAHKLLEGGSVWVDPIIDPNNVKMAQVADAWTHDIPHDENELSDLLDVYEHGVNTALKDKLVKPLKPLAKPTTARVSSEKSALKPLVIPKFWFMNNSPHGARPLNTLIKDDMAWLKSKGINNVTPVRAVARTFGGDGMAARYVMGVAFRLELSPREMIDYTDGMVMIESPIETEDDIAAFWKEQAVKHAKTEKRYMDDKQHLDLKVFDIVKSHGRWTLGLADKAVASVANRHGFSIAARVGREYDAAHAWHVLINDAARDWPIKVNMFYPGHPRDELFNPFRQIDPDLKVQRSDGGSARKPFTYVICNVRDSDAALRFALAKLKQDEFPEIDGSKESRWFAHEVVEALGKHNFKHDSDLIEYADRSKLNSPAPIGLMARLRKLIGL